MASGIDTSRSHPLVRRLGLLESIFNFIDASETWGNLVLPPLPPSP
jgi:hypothetical protein